MPPAEKGSVFAPGQTIDLAIEYGDPNCEGDLEQASYTAQLGDGSTVELSIDAAGMEWLDRLYTKECAIKTIADIASIEYGPRFTRDVVDGRQVLTGELVLRRPDGLRRQPTAHRAQSRRQRPGSARVEPCECAAGSAETRRCGAADTDPVRRVPL